MLQFGFCGNINSMTKYKPVSLKKVKTYSIRKRKNKVSLAAVASIPAKGETFRTFLDSLPDILAAKNFKAVKICIYPEEAIQEMGDDMQHL